MTIFILICIFFLLLYFGVSICNKLDVAIDTLKYTDNISPQIKESTFDTCQALSDISKTLDVIASELQDIRLATKDNSENNTDNTKQIIERLDELSTIAFDINEINRQLNSIDLKQ